MLLQHILKMVSIGLQCILSICPRYCMVPSHYIIFHQQAMLHSLCRCFILHHISPPASSKVPPAQRQLPCIWPGSCSSTNLSLYLCYLFLHWLTAPISTHGLYVQWLKLCEYPSSLMFAKLLLITKSASAPAHSPLFPSLPPSSPPPDQAVAPNLSFL